MLAGLDSAADVVAVVVVVLVSEVFAGVATFSEVTTFVDVAAFLVCVVTFAPAHLVNLPAASRHGAANTGAANRLAAAIMARIERI